MAEPHMIGDWSCGVSAKFGTRFASCRSSSVECRPDGSLRTRGFVPLPVLRWVTADVLPVATELACADPAATRAHAAQAAPASPALNNPNAWLVINDGGGTHIAAAQLSEAAATECAKRHGDRVVRYTPALNPHETDRCGQCGDAYGDFRVAGCLSCIGRRKTEHALDRLVTVIDEEFGLQPVAESPDALVSLLERLLNERRQRELGERRHGEAPKAQAEWVAATALPSWLTGQYWLQFDDLSVGARPAWRDNGFWFYDEKFTQREHGTVIAICRALPPAPTSAKEGE